MNSESIAVSSYEELNDYLSKGAVVTLTIDETELNVVKSRKLHKTFLNIQHYGKYPFERTLNLLLGRYNIKVNIYKNPPNVDKCPIAEELLEIWLGRR